VLLHSPTDAETRWRVVKVLAGDVVDLGAKVKVPRGEVVYFGDRDGAVVYLDARGAAGMPVVYATRTSGYGGTSTSGDEGTSTSGDEGTSTSGYWGTSTSGYGGTSTSGDGGTSTSGYGGTSTSGDWGTLILFRWDGQRRRVHVAHVGEDGIEPNVPYRLDGAGNFVRADQ
jgi:hypothetical protein